jgi:hypothetical protein
MAGLMLPIPMLAGLAWLPFVPLVVQVSPLVDASPVK